MQKNTIPVFALSFFFLMSSGKLIAADNVFFVRLNIDEERIELGEFTETVNKEVTSGFDVNSPLDESLGVLQQFFEENVPPEKVQTILFFIHAMWGSNNLFVRSQVLDFEASYIHATDSPVQAVFYVLWDTRPVTYGGNAKNAIQSSELLNKLFEVLYAFNGSSNYHFNLMCHSMGNKAFFDVLETEKFDKQLFDHIILAAPDVNEDKLNDEHVMANLTAIAGNCYVLYNMYDGLLTLSKARNKYAPLGLRPDTSITEQHANMHFINCSFLTDNNKFPSSITGHLYYSTSVATKRKIKELLST